MKQNKRAEFLRCTQRARQWSRYALLGVVMGGLLWRLQAQARPPEAPAHWVDVHVRHADWLVPDVATEACKLQPEVVQALARAQVVLEPLGMALRLYRCWESGVAGHAQGAGVDVALWVKDAEKAATVLHSPLAEDEPVDMGTEHGQPDSGPEERFDRLSPDAQEHRRWLREVLARQGLQGGNAWWHFEYPAASQGVVQMLHAPGAARPLTAMAAGLCGHLPVQEEEAGVAVQQTPAFAAP